MLSTRAQYIVVINTHEYIYMKSQKEMAKFLQRLLSWNSLVDQAGLQLTDPPALPLESSD